MMFFASSGLHSKTSLHGQLDEIEADCAPRTDHQYIARCTVGDPGLGLPGSQLGARCGVAA